jgi:hypothetical protein
MTVWWRSRCALSYTAAAGVKADTNKCLHCVNCSRNKHPCQGVRVRGPCVGYSQHAVRVTWRVACCPTRLTRTHRMSVCAERGCLVAQNTCVSRDITIPLPHPEQPRKMPSAHSVSSSLLGVDEAFVSTDKSRHYSGGMSVQNWNSQWTMRTQLQSDSLLADLNTIYSVVVPDSTRPLVHSDTRSYRQGNRGTGKQRLPRHAHTNAWTTTDWASRSCGQKLARE